MEAITSSNVIYNPTRYSLGAINCHEFDSTGFIKEIIPVSSKSKRCRMFFKFPESFGVVSVFYPSAEGLQTSSLHVSLIYGKIKTIDFHENLLIEGHICMLVKIKKHLKKEGIDSEFIGASNYLNVKKDVIKKNN